MLKKYFLLRPTLAKSEQNLQHFMRFEMSYSILEIFLYIWPVFGPFANI